MDKRMIGVFAFALVVALATSFGVYRLLSNRILASSTKSTEVYVAARDIAVGLPLTEQDIKAAKWNAPLPKNAITDKLNLIDRALMQPMLEGELFTESRVAPKGGGVGLAAKIPPGMRAIAVKVNDVVGVAGFVLPGMRVDVIALGERPDSSRANDPYGTRSKTLLQNVEVLSAGQNIETSREGKPAPVQVVNLLVTPEQAEMLSLVGTEAKLQLLLRNPLDTAEVKTPGTAQGIVFGDMPGRLPNAGAGAPVQRASAPKPPPPPKTEMVKVPVMMEIISGAKRNEVKVGETEEERPVETGRKK